MVNNDTIQLIVNTLNSEIKKQGLGYRIVLTCSFRTKKFWVSRENSFERRVGEIKLIKEITIRGSKEKNLLLWRDELPVPPKVKGQTIANIESQVIDSLYRNFLYEAITIFGISCEQLIKNKDYSEYDIEKDRLKPDPEFDGAVVEVEEDGKWYEKGNTFDVYTQRGDSWIVYTGHDIGASNNGLAKLSGDICKLIVRPPKKSELISLDGKALDANEVPKIQLLD